MKKVSLILSTIIGFALASSVSAALVYNPDTGHWYGVVDSGPDGCWTAAEAAAIALGGHLVTINDAAEEQWLRNMFGLYTRFWIGFNDEATEGVWVWSSGETPGYTHWAPGEPNDYRGIEDYAVLNWDTSGAWNDWHHLQPEYTHTDGIAGVAGGGYVPDGGAGAGFLALGLLGLAAANRLCKA